jgi:alpha-tubulin suppressor-like RCC1 family protein
VATARPARGKSREAPPAALSRVPFSRDVACGSSHCCVLAGANAVSCWGDNLFNQLGREGPASGVPVAVPMPARVDQLLASERTTCARLQGGALWCWGDNSAAQRGVVPLRQSSAAVWVR